MGPLPLQLINRTADRYRTAKADRLKMGFRFQRRIKIFRGLTLNLSKSGVGFSAGVRGLRVGIDAKGRRYTSASVPGTGLSWRSYKRASTRRELPQGPPSVIDFRCPACGMAYQLRPKFCSRCGHQLTNPSVNAATGGGRRQSARTIGIAVVILAAALLFVLSLRASEPLQLGVKADCVPRSDSAAAPVVRETTSSAPSDIATANGRVPE